MAKRVCGRRTNARVVGIQRMQQSGNGRAGRGANVADRAAAGREAIGRKFRERGEHGLLLLQHLDLREVLLHLGLELALRDAVDMLAQLAEYGIVVVSDAPISIPGVECCWKKFNCVPTPSKNRS